VIFVADIQSMNATVWQVTWVSKECAEEFVDQVLGVLAGLGETGAMQGSDQKVNDLETSQASCFVGCVVADSKFLSSFCVCLFNFCCAECNKLVIIWIEQRTGLMSRKHINHSVG